MEESALKQKLEEIKEKIKGSCTQDSNRIEYFISYNNMLKEILTKDSIEEYFSNNEADVEYFIQVFLNETLNFILIGYKINKKSDDEIVLEILVNLYNLFLKFHKKKKYAQIFEIIRGVFNTSKHNFFEDSLKEGKDSIEKDDYSKFNSKYNSEFISEENPKRMFKEGDIVDIPIEYDKYLTIDKYCWVRGRIKLVTNEGYRVTYLNNKEKIISLSDLNIYPCGTKTIDWDWRSDLKKWDLIDCYDRNKWYPSTVREIYEKEDNEGIKYSVYLIGFRIYPEHFNNIEDPEDKAENYKDIWKHKEKSVDLEIDYQGEKYYGERERYYEKYLCFLKEYKNSILFLNYNYKI